MRLKVWLSFACLALAGCAGSGDGSFPAQCALSPSQDPVFNGNKVQVQSHASGASDTDTILADAIVPSGTRLAVLLKDSCLLESGGLDEGRAGDIARELNVFGHRPTPAGVQSYTWTLPYDMNRDELRSLADGDECIVGVGEEGVATVQVDEFIEVASPAMEPSQWNLNDPMVAGQRHLQMLEALSSYEIFYDGLRGISKGAVIAVIDTGIDMDHPDLKTRLWVNPGEIPNNGKDDDGNGYVDDVNGYNFASRKPSPGFEGDWNLVHHGTHVAGLAVAQSFNGVGVSGVMGWGAKVMMLNVFGTSSGAIVSNTANAIRYAADNGAHVINLSIGGSSDSSTYKSALAYAIRKGVTVVAAAGNSSQLISTSNFATPAAYAREFAGMLAVGSVDSVSGIASRFSNYSPSYIEIAAPGSEDSTSYYGLLSTLPDGRYGRLQGTSMASPLVAGAAALAHALLRSRDYVATPARVERILRNSAQKVESLANRYYQGNVLNLRNVADYIVRYYPPLGETGQKDTGHDPDAGVGDENDARGTIPSETGGSLSHSQGC